MTVLRYILLLFIVGFFARILQDAQGGRWWLALCGFAVAIIVLVCYLIQDGFLEV